MTSSTARVQMNIPLKMGYSSKLYVELLYIFISDICVYIIRDTKYGESYL